MISREMLFKLTAFSLPFFVIVLAELLLPLFHYGHHTDLFIEYPQNPDYFVLNPHASKRYFTDIHFAPSGNKELFRKKKGANTLRFFVLGESTTIGYPYFHNGSFHRWLLYRLMHTYPDKDFEMINLSLTAVNSYAVKGFAEGLARYEPDAVLIYTGHNEYYGGLGVASAQTIGANPAVVNAVAWMRRFRIVQLLMNGYQSLKKKPEETQLTRMELMAGNQHIYYQSALFRKGLRQFEYNMNAALRILQKKHIPIFFSNVVSNLKDLPPFVSDEQDSSNAMYHYRKGQSFYREGNYPAAAGSFVKAKDADLLRFRAPEELNQLIEDLCSRYPTVYYVDSKKALEEYAPHRIPGDELFTDHVHPNLKGFALLADAFYRKLSESPLLPPARHEIRPEEWERTMPVSPIDSIAGEFRIRQLKAHWPFDDSLYMKPLPEYSIEEKLAAQLFRKEADWLTVHNTLYAAYVRLNQLDKAARIAEATVLEYAEDPVFYEQTAMLYGELGKRDLAAFYLKRAFRLSPSFDKAHYLTVLCLMADQPEESLPYLEYALAHPDGKLDLAPLKPLAEHAVSLKKQLMEDSAQVGLLYDMAVTYRRMNNREGVTKYVSCILQIDPRHRDALALKTTYLTE
ncbi:MAG: GDSL-type esterase/lipase family protein [Tannerellaceae bacterium]|jgi:tetratricopeptide (TPR) repeat protein|nr:GDSL-type esterase/lipase family protein [Tannerellaceae bacterium]